VNTRDSLLRRRVAAAKASVPGPSDEERKARYDARARAGDPGRGGWGKPGGKPPKAPEATAQGPFRSFEDEVAAIAAGMDEVERAERARAGRRRAAFYAHFRAMGRDQSEAPGQAHVVLDAGIRPTASSRRPGRPRDRHRLQKRVFPDTNTGAPPRRAVGLDAARRGSVTAGDLGPDSVGSAPCGGIISPLCETRPSRCAQSSEPGNGTSWSARSCSSRGCCTTCTCQAGRPARRWRA
jgi:hypothetical protein